jgi:hypothetical protein
MIQYLVLLNVESAKTDKRSIFLLRSNAFAAKSFEEGF